MTEEEVRKSSGYRAYRDIFDRERPRHEGDWFSARHPRMDRENRAKLFAAFDALDGYGDALAENERLFVPRPVLSEEEAEVLQSRLLALANRPHRGRGTRVTVRFFVPLARDRGQVQTLEGVLEELDPYAGWLRIKGTWIDFRDLLSL